MDLFSQMGSAMDKIETTGLTQEMTCKRWFLLFGLLKYKMMQYKKRTPDPSRRAFRSSILITLHFWILIKRSRTL
jgi:hypothetical protein